MRKLQISPGDKYGGLSIIEEVKPMKKARCFLCKCDCGNLKVVRLEHLRRGSVVSCGCLNNEKRKVSKNIKHGYKGTRIYRIWNGMKQRCLNPNSPNYKRYGGRGIKICDEWMNFENFLNWAKSTEYNDTLSIERDNYNRNYEPSNCRWATCKEQANNRSNNTFITVSGITLNIKQWSEYLNVGYSFLKHKLDTNIPAEDIISRLLDSTRQVISC
jgi:hypothetical protein